MKNNKSLIAGSTAILVTVVNFITKANGVMGFIERITKITKEDLIMIQNVLDMLTLLAFIVFLVWSLIWSNKIEERLKKYDEQSQANNGKLLALKTFRDKEMIRVIDHYNAQLKDFEDRFGLLQNALKEKGIDASFLTEKIKQDENAIIHEKHDNDAKEAEIRAYNREFEGFGKPYGYKGELSTIYGKDYVRQQ